MKHNEIYVYLNTSISLNTSFWKLSVLFFSTFSCCQDKFYCQFPEFLRRNLIRRIQVFYNSVINRNVGMFLNRIIYECNLEAITILKMINWKTNMERQYYYDTTKCLNSQKSLFNFLFVSNFPFRTYKKDESKFVLL